VIIAVFPGRQLAQDVLVLKRFSYAANTWKTRGVQWRHYNNYCALYGFNPLPASEACVCGYIAFMSKTFKYSSIINYLSALWVYHDLNGATKIKGSFSVKQTLRGARRFLGDTVSPASPLSSRDLLHIYVQLDLNDVIDLCFWCCVLLCFRALLRSSNVTDPELCVLRGSFDFESWGLLLRVYRTKTIQFKEEVLTIPLASVPYSPLCAVTYIKLYFSKVPRPPTSPAFGWYVFGRFTPVSYSWFNRKLATLARLAGVAGRVSTHSLRRGGATALSLSGMPLPDIKDRGGWKSLCVLLYITKPLSNLIQLERRYAALVVK
jgi:hypothetical protein